MRCGTTVSLLMLVALGGSAPPEAPACEANEQLVTRVVLRTSAVRAAPSPEADSVGFIAQDAQVPVLGCGSGWCEVSSPLFRGYVPEGVLATARPAPTPAPETRPTPRRNCCRVCTNGKACGNSCIARNRTCRQPPGCACDG